MAAFVGAEVRKLAATPLVAPLVAVIVAAFVAAAFVGADVRRPDAIALVAPSVAVIVAAFALAAFVGADVRRLAATSLVVPFVPSTAASAWTTEEVPFADDVAAATELGTELVLELASDRLGLVPAVFVGADVRRLGVFPLAAPLVPLAAVAAT